MGNPVTCRFHFFEAFDNALEVQNFQCILHLIKYTDSTSGHAAQIV